MEESPTIYASRKTETPCAETSMAETPEKKTESPPLLPQEPPQLQEILSPPVESETREMETSEGSGPPRPVTPPLAMFTPERSRQFHPLQASPSYVLSPLGMAGKEALGQMQVREPMVCASRANFESDGMASGKDDWEGPDVMVID